MTINGEPQAAFGPDGGGLPRVAFRALGALLRRWPTVIAVLVVLHAYLAVIGICSVIPAPWCPPVPDRGNWFGTPGYHLSIAVSTLVAAFAWAVGAAVLLPRLAASWPDGQASDDAPVRFSPVALGRCLVVGLIFAAVVSLASVPEWYVSFRGGGFSPSSQHWNLLSAAESLYRLATSVALAPLQYLTVVAIVHDELPIGPAFAQARDAIAGWTSSVAGPIWLLALLRPGTLWAFAPSMLASRLFTLFDDIAPVVWMLRFADAASVVFTLALALGLWRDVCAAAAAPTA